MEINIFNESDYAKYVEGGDQQPFHVNTGWILAGPIMEEEQNKFEDILRETFITVADPTAGVL